ncbi:type IX secretion system anionic LPS delivery protein PorZ [Thermophagus sp. OGC60D27]|uniref:type IX secretion system anionic LPS delivery protein PorZ n=1 Tax=Thermophagus sp. OGC60D27 TaxID=3458415 RepID=UPI004037CAF2
MKRAKALSKIPFAEEVLLSNNRWGRYGPVHRYYLQPRKTTNSGIFGCNCHMNALNKTTLVLLFFFIFCFSGQTQNQWTTHYSYKECFDITENSQFVIGATKLGLILYHKETQSLFTRNKSNGLSDSNISAIATVYNKNWILVGYENGNIDILRDDRVNNIPDLKNEQMSQSKSINHFLYHNGRVFCSTDFGVIELNIEKDEIVSTLIIGDDASFLKVNKTLILNDTIYAATSAGLLMADMNKVLLYYKNWEHLSEDHAEYCDLIAHPSGILAARGYRGANCHLTLFNHQGTSDLSTIEGYYGTTPIDKGYIITTQDRILFSDFLLNISSSQETIIDNTGNVYHPSFRGYMIDKNQKHWIADWKNGLFLSTNHQQYQQILPGGPYSNSVYKSKKIGNELWVIPGGFGTFYENTLTPASVSILKDGEWIYFDSFNTPEFGDVYDLVNVEANPQNPDNVFVSSWGYGVFEFDKDNDNNIYLKNHYTENNVDFNNSTSPSSNDPNVKIWGLTFDERGHLFMTHSDNTNVFIAYDTYENIWHHFNYGTMALLAPIVGEITIDNNGFKWAPILQSYKGIFVFDDNGTIDNFSDDRYRGPLTNDQDTDNRNAGLLEFWDEYGEVSIHGALCIDKDKNGYLWFGTENGVIVQYNPGKIFDDPKPIFSRIKVPRNDGSGLADYLLEGEKVTAIAVDGANRKYIGTEGNGVYLLSEDGTQTVSHFTTDNSPMPSNNIFDIEIDGQTGDVYFSTDQGLISYRGEAIDGKESFSNIYVYPNPVKPGYNDPITITGLMDQTIVKITDTQGNLVYETTSIGGNALWNGKNLKGEKVNSGIYIIFLASPDGMQNGTAKVAIIR